MAKVAVKAKRAGEVFGVRGLDVEVIPFLGSEPEKIPAIDKSYIFQKEALEELLVGLLCGDNVYVYGDSGTGKTTLVKQICARLGAEFWRLNFDGHIGRADLVGDWTSKGGETVFEYGVLPIVMRRPAILLLDEYDAISPEVQFVFQRLLDDDRSLCVTETGGEVFTAGRFFRIIATGNTTGQGDESGLYTGTKVLNYANLDRFGTIVKLGYLKADAETQLLKKHVPRLRFETIEKMVKCITTMRAGFDAGELSIPISIRTSKSWVQKAAIVKDAERAATMVFKTSTVELPAIKAIIQRVGLEKVDFE